MSTRKDILAIIGLIFLLAIPVGILTTQDFQTKERQIKHLENQTSSLNKEIQLFQVKQAEHLKNELSFEIKLFSLHGRVKSLEEESDQLKLERERLERENNSLRKEVERLNRTFPMLSTAYNGAEFNSNGLTISRTPVRWGVVAVDPKVIPLGTKLLIDKFPNTVFMAEDTGEVIVGLRIDIWMPTIKACEDWGWKIVKVTILD